MHFNERKSGMLHLFAYKVHLNTQSSVQKNWEVGTYWLEVIGDQEQTPRLM